MVCCGHELLLVIVFIDVVGRSIKNSLSLVAGNASFLVLQMLWVVADAIHTLISCVWVVFLGLRSVVLSLCLVCDN